MAGRVPVIAGVLDSSLGEESRQVAGLVRSLVAHYGAGEGYLLEPDDSQTPSHHDAWPELKVSRLHTNSPPAARSGTIEYLMRASRRLARVGPDVLVVAAPIAVPVLFKLGDRPRFVISYVRQEPGNSAGIPRWMARAGRASNGRVDLSVFPCAAWARADLRDGVDGAFEIVHDLCQETPGECVPARDRLARIACVDNGGRSLWPVLVEPAMRGIAVDVLGSLDEDSNHAGSAGLRTRLLQSDGAGPRYAGCPAGTELARIRRQYAYRLLDSTDAGCAALLESIADGVPAIVVARPGDAGAEMSRELVERYGCGHVIDGVDPDTCAGAMRRALEIVGTPAHDAMIAGCGRATAREVNWEAGFAKISRHLPRRFD